MKRLIFVTLILLVGCGGGGGVKDKPNIDLDSITQTVDKNYKNIVQNIPTSNLSSFNFLDTEDKFVKNSKLGEPILSYTLSTKKIKEYEEGDEIDFEFMDEVKYPVINDNQIRFLIIYSTSKNKIVKVGEAKVANQLNSIQNYFGSLKELKFITIFFKNSSEVGIFLYDKSKNWLIPLKGAREILGVSDSVDSKSFELPKMMKLIQNRI